jgi:hypothetical protein
MGDLAWNLPCDRAWEKAPPYDRAWKRTSHILGICAHIPSIHWAYRSVYRIQAYMILYTRYMVEYKVYDSLFQVYDSIVTFMQMYIDDMQVYSCIYKLK